MMPCSRRAVPGARSLRRGTLVALALLALLFAHVWRNGWGQAAGAAPATLASAQCNAAAFRVVVDVGHTVQAPGAISARGVREYEFNLRLARDIEKKLIEAGFGRTVLLITGGSARSSLMKRVGRANALRADLLVSVHHDSVPRMFREEWEYEGQKNGFCDKFKGHSVFVSHDNLERKASLAFGALLGRELKARGLHYTPHYTQTFMGRWRRDLLDAEAGVYRYDELIVLRRARMPAVLLEAGSIVNRAEELLLESQEHRSLIAAGVVDAIGSFCALRARRGSNGRISMVGMRDF